MGMMMRRHRGFRAETATTVADLAPKPVEEVQEEPLDADDEAPKKRRRKAADD
jgi:hypothetical protein